MFCYQNWGNHFKIKQLFSKRLFCFNSFIIIYCSSPSPPTNHIKFTTSITFFETLQNSSQNFLWLFALLLLSLTPQTERRGPIEEESATRKEEEEGSTKKAPIRSSRARTWNVPLREKLLSDKGRGSVWHCCACAWLCANNKSALQCYLTKENQHRRRALITEGISWKLHWKKKRHKALSINAAQ